MSITKKFSDALDRLMASDLSENQRKDLGTLAACFLQKCAAEEQQSRQVHSVLKDVFDRAAALD